ncbi:MAG: hypothetical protein IIC73_07365, partial [Armatimonadetes bacterium]|nr:hypothetical protein [Armatimonadota bacterium]
GLTAMDISTTKGEYEDWGVFGLGRVNGSSAVVSTFRLNRDGVSEEQFQERLYKVVVHEYGHTVGLPHCTESDVCPMQDKRGKVKTVDDSNSFLCDS